MLRLRRMQLTQRNMTQHATESYSDQESMQWIYELSGIVLHFRPLKKLNIIIWNVLLY